MGLIGYDYASQWLCVMQWSFHKSFTDTQNPLPLQSPGGMSHCEFWEESWEEDNTEIYRRIKEFACAVGPLYMY